MFPVLQASSNYGRTYSVAFRSKARRIDARRCVEKRAKSADFQHSRKLDETDGADSGKNSRPGKRREPIDSRADLGRARCLASVRHMVGSYGFVSRTLRFLST